MIRGAAGSLRAAWSYYDAARPPEPACCRRLAANLDERAFHALASHPDCRVVIGALPVLPSSPGWRAGQTLARHRIVRAEVLLCSNKRTKTPHSSQRASRPIGTTTRSKYRKPENHTTPFNCLCTTTPLYNKTSARQRVHLRMYRANRAFVIAFPGHVHLIERVFILLPVLLIREQREHGSPPCLIDQVQHREVAAERAGDALHDAAGHLGRAEAVRGRDLGQKHDQDGEKEARQHRVHAQRGQEQQHRHGGQHARVGGRGQRLVRVQEGLRVDARHPQLRAHGQPVEAVHAERGRRVRVVLQELEHGRQDLRQAAQEDGGGRECAAGAGRRGRRDLHDGGDQRRRGEAQQAERGGVAESNRLAGRGVARRPDGCRGQRAVEGLLEGREALVQRAVRGELVRKIRVHGGVVVCEKCGIGGFWKEVFGKRLVGRWW